MSEKKRISYDEGIQMVKDAVATFDENFGLKRYPGLFRISVGNSFYSPDTDIQLVVQVKTPGIGWQDFARCGVQELRNQVVRI